LFVTNVSKFGLLQFCFTALCYRLLAGVLQNAMFCIIFATVMARESSIINQQLRGSGHGLRATANARIP